MAGITGIETTFNLPNYHGELFAVSPADTPLLSAIGGLTGGQQTDATTFEWTTFDKRCGATRRTGCRPRPTRHPSASTLRVC